MLNSTTPVHHDFSFRQGNSTVLEMIKMIGHFAIE